MNMKLIFEKQIISGILAVTTLLLSMATFSASAQTETEDIIKYTLYENTFDNGKADLKAASDEGNLFENRFLIYDGVGSSFGDVETVSYIPEGKEAENMAIRVGRGDWTSGKTFLLDFTKNNTQNGIRSGIVRASFDFGVDADSSANAVRIGMNMTGDNTDSGTGGRMMYFVRETNSSGNSVFKYQIASSVGGSMSSGINRVIDADSQHHLEIVMDFDENEVTYFLDNEMIMSDGEAVTQKLTGTIMNNFMIALGGIFEYFDNFKVTQEFKKPLECVINSETDEEHPGNIFFDNEQIVLNLNVINRDDVEYSSVPVLITATDLNDNIVETKTVNVSISAFGEADFPIELNLPRYGVYKLSVTSENSVETTARVSRSVGNTGNNPKVNVHMQVNGGKVKDVGKTFKLMDRAGLGGVRTDMGWNAVRNTNGTVAHSTGGDQYIDAAVEESKKTGVEILALMSTGNKNDIYPNDEDEGFNTSNAYLQGFYEYCNTIAKKYGDHIKWWELGNEDNYRQRIVSYDQNGKAVYGPDSGENYAKILNKGYQGIKDAYDDAVILNSGSAVVLEDEENNASQFAKDLLSSVQADPNNKYFDRFATHSYHPGMMPEVRDRWIYNSEWDGYMSWADREVFLKKNILKPYGHENTPTWVTETGYYVGTRNGDVRSEEIVAAYNVRLLLLNEINGFHEKMFLYNFMNDGFDSGNSEHNYGMLRNWDNADWKTRSAYAAKLQYLAVAQWNKMMNGATYVSCERNVDYSESKFDNNEIIVAPKDSYNAKFTSGDDVIHILWDVFDNCGTSTVENTEDKKYIIIYDMYGNVTEVLQNAKSVVYDPTENPSYIVLSDELPESCGYAEEPEILFHRDFEDYTGGDPLNQDVAENAYGTWEISGDDTWSDYTAADSLDGKGFYVTKGHYNDGAGAFPDISDGTLYVAFDEIPGDNPTETSVYFKTGTPNFAFSYKPGVSWTALDRNWGYDQRTAMLGSGQNHKIELVINPATGDAKRYINGNYIGTKNIGITTGLTEMLVRFSATSVIDNFTVIYFPEKMVCQTFSLDSARLNKDNTISVFLKSDAVDSDGANGKAIRAPYGITLPSTDETNTTYTLASDLFTVDGATVTGVTRGNATGEYIIAVNEILSEDETYIVTAKSDISDITGSRLNKDKAVAVAGKQEFAVTSIDMQGNCGTVTYTNTTDSDESFELIIASYNENGVMEEIASKQVSAKKASVSGTDSVSLTQDVTGKTVKMFVWRDFLSLKPFILNAANDR